MTIIFDENIPLPMRDWFSDQHQVTTVQLEGWSGIANGELVSHMDGKFHLFVTADKNLRYQQNLASRRIAIIELPTNRWPLLKPLRGQVIKAVNAIRASDYIVVQG